MQPGYLVLPQMVVVGFWASLDADFILTIGSTLEADILVSISSLCGRYTGEKKRGFIIGMTFSLLLLLIACYLNMQVPAPMSPLACSICWIGHRLYLTLDNPVKMFWSSRQHRRISRQQTPGPLAC